jgi:hypothetical protein
MQGAPTSVPDGGISRSRDAQEFIQYLIPWTNNDAGMINDNNFG